MTGCESIRPSSVHWPQCCLTHTAHAPHSGHCSGGPSSSQRSIVASNYTGRPADVVKSAGGRISALPVHRRGARDTRPAGDLTVSTPSGDGRPHRVRERPPVMGVRSEHPRSETELVGDRLQNPTRAPSGDPLLDDLGSGMRAAAGRRRLTAWCVTAARQRGAAPRTPSDPSPGAFVEDAVQQGNAAVLPRGSRERRAGPWLFGTDELATSSRCGDQRRRLPVATSSEPF